MKLKNKILTAIAPIATIAVVSTPIILTSCSAQSDIYLQSNQPKTLELKDSLLNYQTEENTLILSIADKYEFPYDEHETHTFLIETQNLQFSKPVKSGTFTLGFKADGWSYHGEPKKSTSFMTNFTVSNCVLEKGTEITFDLKVTYGTVDAATKKTFTKISNTCTFTGWKLTY